MEGDVRPTETSQSAAGEYKAYVTNCMLYLENDNCTYYFILGGNGPQLWQRYPVQDRMTDFSYPRPLDPKNETSLWRTYVPQERKFQGTFVPC